MKSDLLKTMSLLFFAYLALFSRYKHLYIGNWIGLFPQILKKFSEGLRFDVTQLSSKFSPTFGKIIVCTRGLALWKTSKMADQSSSGSINSGSFESSLFIRMSEFYPEFSSGNSYAFWSTADIFVYRPTDNVLPYQFEPDYLLSGRAVGRVGARRCYRQRKRRWRHNSRFVLVSFLGLYKKKFNCGLVKVKFNLTAFGLCWQLLLKGQSV